LPDKRVTEFVDFSAGVEAIAESLPTPSFPRRRKLLPKILHEWSAHELRDHLSREPRDIIRRRATKQKLLAKCARQLLGALDALDDNDLGHVAYQMRQRGRTSDRSEIVKINNWLDEAPEFLGKLASISPQHFWNLKRGQPRNLIAYLVLRDAAAIFEWYSGKKAARTVDRVNATESGPFFRFARVLWPIIFSDVAGLPAAMKNWAFARSKFKEPSPLIVNIGLRHPEWGLFER
jgi:hypothetical protein